MRYFHSSLFTLSSSLIILLCIFPTTLWAQDIMRTNRDRNVQNGEYDSESGTMPVGATNRFSWGRDAEDDKNDEEEEYPIGQFQWRIDRRLGTVIDAENNDTVVHNFQNFNLTEGYTGQYNFLGNLGAPRLNRIFMNREENEQFIFLQPFSFFRGSLQDFRFTNTLSPITNLAYHRCGNDQNGEDRVRAYFASNINKISGIGFKMDYLYGRGYYNSQQTSHFGGTFYGYYRGEKYNAHAYINICNLKMAENGGIENDRYIEDPQSFPQRYSSKDIPVNITDTWNQNHNQTFYLTHRYNAGFDRELEVPDSLKPKMPSDGELLTQLNDSIRTLVQADSIMKVQALDSLKNDWQSKQIAPTEFVPVTSFIHTFDLQKLTHSYLSHSTPTDYYTNHYYGSWNDVHDDTRGLAMKNTLGVALREGFNKWAQMGITLYATHFLGINHLPVLGDTVVWNKKYTENEFSVGANLSRAQGRFIHYNVDGELWILGDQAGDFNVHGEADSDIPLGRKDTLTVIAEGGVRRILPSFYWRHYHNQAVWWDHENLSHELRSRFMGTLDYKRTKTRLTVGIENLKDYTYMGMTNTLKDGKDAESTMPGDYTHDVAVRQYGGNVQIFSAMLRQDVKAGPFLWENEVTWQRTSNAEVLPLPDISLYTNMCLVFRIAKVLRVQVGGDMRYFTSYYAPDYSPACGQFAVQDEKFARVKVGNYPIVNVYINLHLKHCRLYLAMNHVNQGSGHYYWAPHYPVNPRTFHFGLSWNFFN